MARRRRFQVGECGSCRAVVCRLMAGIQFRDHSSALSTVGRVRQWVSGVQSASSTLVSYYALSSAFKASARQEAMSSGYLTETSWVQTGRSRSESSVGRIGGSVSMEVECLNAMGVRPVLDPVEAQRELGVVRRLVPDVRRAAFLVPDQARRQGPVARSGSYSRLLAQQGPHCGRCEAEVTCSGSISARLAAYSSSRLSRRRWRRLSGHWLHHLVQPSPWRGSP